MLFSHIFIASALAFLAHAQSNSTSHATSSLSSTTKLSSTTSSSSSLTSSSATSTRPTTTSVPASLSLSPAESTKAINDLSAYYSSLTTAPGFSAAASVLNTAIPTSVSSQLENDPSGLFSSLATATAEPSWFTAMPTSVQSFWSSVGAQQISIVTKAAAGPAPTHAAKVAGVILAAGGAVVAML